ncbi:type I restriction enzyme HsdR N-terminal domain-containing protein [Halorarius halobius]|uniref:type I restriction enzyme HsdR N-terminal domain-containing protein n=1 Tax=Halorarius halobius TaxID=2962671 RepID=UPI0020CDDBFF|nr:type I restriction enzyme HsdR N-terminal domain-containing protein [Halorarius halobius]
MNRDAVREYIEQSDAVLESSPQMDEANTKAAVLRDFLDLLDWQIPENTQLEYSVEAFGQTYKVDYALILDGTPVAFLEAKGADTALTADHDEQLSSYMMNKNVNYGVLTNGKQYRFFQRRVDASNVDVQKVGNVSLEDLPNRLAVLKAYEKDAIESGESGKILGRINELREARRTLEADKDDLAVELSNVLADEVSDSISSLAETQAKEMIDRLVADIESEIDADGKKSKREIAGSLGETPEKVEASDVDGEYVIEIQGDESTLVVLDGDNQSDVMANAVDYLIQNHDLISRVEPLPYVPGNKNALINNQPVHPDGERDMRTYRELTNGYYLFTSFNKRDKKRHIQRLADKCDLAVESRGEW